MFRGCTAVIKPAERVLRRQVPRGGFSTSVELRHLQCKCLLAKQRVFLSSANRYWGAQPEGPSRGMFCWTRKQLVFQTSGSFEKQKSALKFSLRSEDLPRTEEKIFRGFFRASSSKLKMFSVSEGGPLPPPPRFSPLCAINNSTYLLQSSTGEVHKVSHSGFAMWHTNYFIQTIA